MQAIPYLKKFDAHQCSSPFLRYSFPITRKNHRSDTNPRDPGKTKKKGGEKNVLSSV
jgi:hypothetical protein